MSSEKSFNQGYQEGRDLWYDKIKHVQQQLMDQAVSHEQEVIKLKDEITGLKHLAGRNQATYAVNIAEITSKSQAWDDLEALMDQCGDSKYIMLKIIDDTIEIFREGTYRPIFSRYFNAQAVSKALQSIKGEG